MFLILLIFNNNAFSEDSGFTEAFIAFQTSKTSGDKFYRVLVDEEENPYLDLKDVIEKHLGLTANYDIRKKSCTVRIVAAGGTFSIDGRQGEYTSIDNKGRSFKKSFPKNNLIVSEKRLWIRYDLLSGWIPVRIVWELDRYYMRFMPGFPLLKEIIESRKRTRENNKERLKEKKKKDRIKPIEPDGNFETELRLKLNGSLYDKRYNEENSYSSYLALDLNSDIYKGTLKINGLFSHNDGDDTDSNFSWRYKRYNRNYFNLFEAGNLYNDSSLLIPTTTVKNGINIKRLEKEEGKTGFNFAGTTLPGTDIDIYINGFIAGSYKATDGSYNFSNFEVAGGQIVMLKFYFSDGSTKTEMYQISADAGKIIPKGEWDYQLYGGEEDDEEREDDFFGFFNVRYGLLDNLTFGGYSIKYPLIEVNGFDMAWKPLPGIFVTSEHMFAEETSGNAFSLDLNYPPNNFRFESRLFDEDSPLIDLQSTDYQYSRYNFARYVRNSNGWYVNIQYTDTTGYTKYQSVLKKRLLSFLSVSTDNSVKIFKDDTENIENNILGADILFGKHNIRVNWNIDSYQSISYRYQPGRNSKYYVTASCNHYEDDDNWDAFLSFTFKFNDFISTTGNISDSGNRYDASIEGIVAGKYGPDKSDQFALGTLYGKVELKTDNRKTTRPVSGVTVMAGSRKTVTDSDGMYVITGLPAEQRITVRIMPSSLELGLTPKDDYVIVKFRPGTKIKYDPVIFKTIGIDGIIECDCEIPEGSKITAVNLKTGKKISTGEIDPDGFFIIEGIRPGLYNFVVKGLKDKDYVFKYDVKGDKEWISELKLTIGN